MRDKCDLLATSVLSQKVYWSMGKVDREGEFYNNGMAEACAMHGLSFRNSYSAASTITDIRTA